METADNLSGKGDINVGQQIVQLEARALDYEGYSAAFWNVQCRIQLLNNERFAHAELLRENLAQLIRLQHELTSLRSVWLETVPAKPLPVCTVCGGALRVEQKPTKKGNVRVSR